MPVHKNSDKLNIIYMITMPQNQLGAFYLIYGSIPGKLLLASADRRKHDVAIDRLNGLGMMLSWTYPRLSLIFMVWGIHAPLIKLGQLMRFGHQ